jgi:hydrogenase maturation protease
MSQSAVVICVGNAFRGDDGAGLAVLERLRARGVPGLDVVGDTGDPAALIEHWSGRRLAIVVDAVRSGVAPGTAHRVVWERGEWHGTVPQSATSSHALGVATAVALAQALDRAPARIVVLGVEVGDVTQGVMLSAPVAAAVDRLVESVVTELGEASR